MSTLPIHIDHNGEERKLGYRFPTPDAKRMRASNTDINSITTVLPQSQWKEVDYVTGSPKELILNQLQEGACVGGSCAGANARMRWMRTGNVIIPSLWFIYDQINGGVDQGAVIDDAQTAMMTIGAPPVAAYPKSLWVAGKIPPGVPMYKEDVPVNLTTSAEFATALMLGWLPQGPVMVDNTFENFTSEGVAWGGRAPRGNQSNHSVYFAGLKNLPIAGWVLKLVNDWDLSWGPFGEGWCYAPLAAVDNPAMSDDAFCHVSTLDPADLPPAPA